VSNYEIGATPPGHLHEPTRINGVVREAVVVTDRVANPGLAYTTDGLFAGSLLADRVDDGLPGWVYQWGAVKGKSLMNHDCAQGGAVTKVGGEVYWLAPGGQPTPVYRIHGWDDWERIEGTVTLTEAPAHASGEGSGLRGRYFDDADADLDGSPTATRTDESIWFGIQGAHRNPDASRSWGRFGPDGRVGRHANARDWSSGPAEGVSAPFAARWTGEVEAQLSEAFRFTAYAVGGARLWVDGEQVVSAWEGSQVQHVSNPVRLTAGERYAVRLEYRATSAYPALSLNWDSFTQERERIPTAYLYPNE
jgi:hypothetical protein